MRPAFIGRAAELAMLDGALARASEGDGIAVLVRGEAGIGKTRLVLEFSALATRRGATVLSGGCVESGAAGLPYGPIAQALHSAASAGLLDPVGLHAAVIEQLAILVPALGRIGAGDPTHFELAGLGQVRLFEALLATVEFLSAERPLVIIIEDIHWADRSTLDLMTFLVRNVESASCVIVATVRTDEVSRGGPLATTLAELIRRPAVERLDLLPLDLEETAAHLRSMLGAELDDRTVERIHRRSDGNPFFVEQLAWAHRDGEDVVVPPSLRDVLLNQLSRQPQDVQALLAAAAIAGPHADEALLSAISDLSREAVVVALRQAVRSNLLVPVGDDVGETYPFRHALMAEAVEADLLDSERRRLRTRCADALVGRQPSDGVERAQWAARIAHHRDLAGDAAGTMAASLQAALAAEAIAARQDALVQYRRAIRILRESPGLAAPDGWDHAEIYLRAAETAAIAGEAQEAARLSGAALDHLPANADPFRRGSVLTRHSEYLWIAGDDRFLGMLREAAAVIPTEPATALRADALIALGFHHKYSGATVEAELAWKEALDVAVATDSARHEALARTCLAQLDLEDGRIETADILLQEALTSLRRAKPDASTSVAYMDLTAATSWATHEALAIEICREGIAAAQAFGFATYYGAGIGANGAESLWSLGRLREAGELLDSVDGGVSGGFAEVGHRITRAMVSTAMGDLGRAHGEITACERWLDAGDRSIGRILGLASAEAVLESGRPEDVRPVVARTLALAPSHTPWEECRAALGWLDVRAAADLAVAARAKRDTAAARQACDTAAAALASLADLLGQPRSERAPDRRRARGYAALAAAEATRLAGGSDPAAWRSAQHAWDGLAHVLRPMYARVREAEARLQEGRVGRAEGVALLVDVHREARACGAALLVAMSDAVGRHARVRLSVEPAGGFEDQVGDTAAAPADRRPYGLTSREVEILALLTGGLTNRQIGERLFISPKTAGVHVSNILDKLDVGNRVQAANVAHHLGLDAEPARQT